MDDDDNQMAVEEVKDSSTKRKCVQTVDGSKEDARDDDTIENNPGAFAAEQTWPTDAEIREAAQRKLSGQDEMVEMDTGSNTFGNFEVGKSILKNKQPEGGSDLTELFDKMQIAVVGRENGNDASDSGISDEDENDEDFDDDEYEEDPNFNSTRH